MFFSIPGLIFTLFSIGAVLHTFSEYYLSAQFDYILFTGGFSMLIFGLLLVAVGLILYSLAQIMLGQEQGRRVVSDSNPADTLPPAEEAGMAEESPSHPLTGGFE